MLNQEQTGQKKISQVFLFALVLSWVVYLLLSIVMNVVVLGFGSDSGESAPSNVVFLLLATNLISFVVMVFMTRMAVIKESILSVVLSIPVVSVVAQVSFFIIGVLFLSKAEIVLPQASETYFTCSSELGVEVSDSLVLVYEIIKSGDVTSKTISGIGRIKDGEISLTPNNITDNQKSQKVIKECKNINSKTVSGLYLLRHE